VPSDERSELTKAHDFLHSEPESDARRFQIDLSVKRKLGTLDLSSEADTAKV
jgi:hypothetical protein